MDFGHLLDIAKGNTTLAKKKVCFTLKQILAFRFCKFVIRIQMLHFEFRFCKFVIRIQMLHFGPPQFLQILLLSSSISKHNLPYDNDKKFIHWVVWWLYIFSFLIHYRYSTPITDSISITLHCPGESTDSV